MVLAAWLLVSRAAVGDGEEPWAEEGEENSFSDETSEAVVVEVEVPSHLTEAEVEEAVREALSQDPHNPEAALAALFDRKTHSSDKPPEPPHIARKPPEVANEQQLPEEELWKQQCASGKSDFGEMALQCAERGEVQWLREAARRRNSSQAVFDMVAQILNNPNSSFEARNEAGKIAADVLFRSGVNFAEIVTALFFLVRTLPFLAAAILALFCFLLIVACK